MLIHYPRVLCSIAVAALFGSVAGPVRAETTSETDGIAHSATVVIVDPLDGAVFDPPASFTVRIESEDGSGSLIESVKLAIDDEIVPGGCTEAGVCNIDVADLAAGEHVLVATVEDFFGGAVSEPVTITVLGAESESETGASETGAATEAGGSATEAASETATASEASGGEAPTTGGEPETDGDSDTTGGGEANDDDAMDKGCGCVAGGGADPLALGLLLLGLPMIRRRRV